MNVSDVLATTMESLRSRGLGLVGIWLGFFVLSIVLGFVVTMAMGGSMLAAAGLGMSGDNFGAGMGLGMIGFLALSYLLYILFYMAQGLTMAHYASPLIASDIEASFGAGIRGSLTMLGVVILLGIASIIVAVLFGILGAVFAMLGDAAAILYALILIPAAFYLMCRLCIIMPVVAVDGVRNPVTAIARTWNLTSGKVMAIFLSLLAYIIAAVVVFGGLFAAFFGTMQSYQESVMMGSEPGFGSLIGFFVSFAVVGLAFAAAGAALVSAIHSKLSDMGTKNLSETFG
jgi:hypothetical protein